ncbi:MAG: GH3 auxin-responsive promoter family protein [Alistipes indistinctus]
MGVNYAMIISTSNGLWRHRNRRYGSRLRVARTLQNQDYGSQRSIFIECVRRGVDHRQCRNGFAGRRACAATGALVSDYTAGPIYMGDRSKGSHQWLIEFNRAPEDMDQFTDCLDPGAATHVNS